MTLERAVAHGYTLMAEEHRLAAKREVDRQAAAQAHYEAREADRLAHPKTIADAVAARQLADAALHAEARGIASPTPATPPEPPDPETARLRIAADALAEGYREMQGGTR